MHLKSNPHAGNEEYKRLCNHINNMKKHLKKAYYDSISIDTTSPHRFWNSINLAVYNKPTKIIKLSLLKF